MFYTILIQKQKIGDTRSMHQWIPSIESVREIISGKSYIDIPNKGMRFYITSQSFKLLQTKFIQIQINRWRIIPMFSCHLNCGVNFFERNYRTCSFPFHINSWTSKEIKYLNP